MRRRKCNEGENLRIWLMVGNMVLYNSSKMLEMGIFFVFMHG